MNVLIVGCGKVGSRLAGVLESQGHDISIVDKDSENFESLPDNFSGYTTVGVPIDQDVLRQAGIETCDAVAAVTQDDNVNIMICQVAREIFKVPRVLARIYDPSRENVFSHFGLRTVCPTNLTIAAVQGALMDDSPFHSITIGNSSFGFTHVPVPKRLIGKTNRDVACEEQESLFAVLHSDNFTTLIGNCTNIVLKENDILVFAKLID